MRNKKQTRISVTITFSTLPDLAQFIEERSVQIGMDRSKYLTALVRHDREENTVGEIAKKQAERLSTPVAA